jgi:hypothetical protein
MGKAEGHHFLPRFYLKSFSPEGGENPRIWVHERDEAAKFLPVSVVAKRTHFYSRPDKEKGGHDVSNEHLLAKVESVMAPVFQKVVANEGVDGLTEEELVTFGGFVLIMSGRTPRNFDIADHSYKELILHTYHEGLKDTSEEELRMIYEKTKKEHPEMDVSFEQAKQWMIEGPTRAHVKLSHSAGLLDMWTMAADVLPIIMEMDWQFLVPPDESTFITTDDPVVSTIQTERGTEFLKGGWGHQSLNVTFPLSPRLCFSATWGGGKGKATLTTDSIPVVNHEVILMSQRYVYANSERTDLGAFMEERDHATKQSPEPYRITKLY